MFANDYSSVKSNLYFFALLVLKKIKSAIRKRIMKESLKAIRNEINLITVKIIRERTRSILINKRLIRMCVYALSSVCQSFKYFN